MSLLLWRHLNRKNNVITNTKIIHRSVPFSQLKEQKITTIQSEKLPNNYYDDINNQKTFVDDAAKRLNINRPNEWYSVTWKVTRLKSAILISSEFCRYRWFNSTDQIFKLFTTITRCSISRTRMASLEIF